MAVLKEMSDDDIINEIDETLVIIGDVANGYLGKNKRDDEDYTKFLSFLKHIQDASLDIYISGWTERKNEVVKKRIKSFDTIAQSVQAEVKRLIGKSPAEMKMMVACDLYDADRLDSCLVAIANEMISITQKSA